MVFTVGGPGRCLQKREVQVCMSEYEHAVVEWTVDTPFHVLNDIRLIDLTASIKLRNKRTNRIEHVNGEATADLSRIVNTGNPFIRKLKSSDIVIFSDVFFRGKILIWSYKIVKVSIGQTSCYDNWDAIP